MTIGNPGSAAADSRVAGDPDSRISSAWRSKPEDSAYTSVSGRHHPMSDEQWSGIDGDAIGRAVCRESIELQGLLDRMRQAGEGKRKDFRLRGFSLKDEAPSLVRALGELIQRTGPDGEPLEEQPEFSAHDYLKTLCDSAVCVARKTFGERIGVKVLYLQWQYGLNASHLTNEDAAHIEEQEVNSFLRVASDFASGALPIMDDQRMVKYERGVRMISRYGGISLANSRMEFFDGWTRLDRNEKDVVTAHEIAHVIGQRTGLVASGGWLGLSGWQRHGGEWSATKPDRLIAENSALSPHEDFADAVTAYRYRPEKLLRRAPEKYDFLKEYVFRGREFRRPAQCKSPRVGA